MKKILAEFENDQKWTNLNKLNKAPLFKGQTSLHTYISVAKYLNNYSDVKTIKHSIDAVLNRLKFDIKDSFLVPSKL